MISLKVINLLAHRNILYGLPKIQKIVIEDIPNFRPILSAIVTPVYKLVRFCTQTYWWSLYGFVFRAYFSDYFIMSSRKTWV